MLALPLALRRQVGDTEQARAGNPGGEGDLMRRANDRLVLATGACVVVASIFVPMAWKALKKAML